MTYPVGLIEAATGVIGEADTEIGGHRITRLTASITTGVALTATYTWDGITTVLTSDTSEVAVDAWIRLDADGRYYKIVSLVPNTSVEIENPYGYVIPTGAFQSSKAVTSFPVETTYGWTDTGFIGVGGIKYTYGSKTTTTFEEITHISAGDVAPGARVVHRAEDPVIDLNRDWSALDLVRRSLFVDYAEGEYLNALGRNLGVFRLPFIADDNQFREAIKRLAYNPKGTLLGLDLALKGLVGEGNYSIYENLPTDHNTVYINLLGSAIVDIRSEGKAFLSDPEWQPATSATGVTVEGEVVDRGVVGQVRWKDENHVTYTNTVRPSSDILMEYIGDTGTQLWAFQGTNEPSQVGLVSGTSQAVNFPTLLTAYYRHLMRIQPESIGLLEIVCEFETTVNPMLDPSPYVGMRLSDTVKHLGVGIAEVDASNVRVGFANLATGTFLGTPVTKSKDFRMTLTVKKDEQNAVVLLIDDYVVDTLAYASFPNAGASDHKAEVGVFGALANSAAGFWLFQIAYQAVTMTDYWAARGGNGDVTSGSRQLDTNIASLFVSGDLGKGVTTKDSAVTNPKGGNNNGTWIIDSVDSDEIVKVIGAPHYGADVETANPLRIIVPENGPLFQYPDDLGKKIEISGSGLGNDGSYVIDKCLEPGTLTDLHTYQIKNPAKTNVIEVVGATFTSEQDLNWRIDPNFTTEANLDWIANGVGDVSGSNLTLPQALPITTGGYTRVLEVWYSRILSGQVLLDDEIESLITQSSPTIEWKYYPFYVADPLGYIREYIDSITAAGVIPEFRIV